MNKKKKNANNDGIPPWIKSGGSSADYHSNSHKIKYSFKRTRDERCTYQTKPREPPETADNLSLARNKN